MGAKTPEKTSKLRDEAGGAGGATSVGSRIDVGSASFEALQSSDQSAAGSSVKSLQAFGLSIPSLAHTSSTRMFAGRQMIPLYCGKVVI
jgi:hypothetical protein